MASSARITVLLILLAVVVCALLNPGNFGTIDTAHRWQVADALLFAISVTVEIPAASRMGYRGLVGAAPIFADIDFRAVVRSSATELWETGACGKCHQTTLAPGLVQFGCR